MPLAGWMDEENFNPGYLMRSIDKMPKRGDKPEWQHTGVAAKLYELHYDAAERLPQKSGETGWTLETNTRINRAMERMGGEIVRTYRVYEKLL